MKVKDFLKQFEDCNPEEQVLIETDNSEIYIGSFEVFRRSLPGCPHAKAIIKVRAGRPMRENHDSSKVRFNPRPLRSVFRRKRDAIAYLEWRGWKQQGSSNVFVFPKLDDMRRIENQGKNKWVIAR